MDKWSKELPQDVLTMILNRFSHFEIVRLGTVCKSWLTVCRKIPQLPWLVMFSKPNSTNDKEEEEAHPCFRLSDYTTFSIKLPEIHGKLCYTSFNNNDGWWLTVDKNMEIQLFHPWRRIQLQLPHGIHFPLSGLYMNIIHMAAMSDDGTTVVVIFHFASLSFCKIRDNFWTRIKSHTSNNGLVTHLTYHEGVVYHKGKFYTLSHGSGSGGYILGLCHIDSAIPYVEALFELLPAVLGRIYLVANSGYESIFLVVSNYFDSLPDEDCKMTVFEIGLEETGEHMKNLVEVESLGDRIMFLGERSSMLVRASEFPRFKENCIYFIEAKAYARYTYLAAYNMEDGSVTRLFELETSAIHMPPIWIKPPVMEGVG